MRDQRRRLSRFTQRAVGRFGDDGGWLLFFGRTAGSIRSDGYQKTVTPPRNGLDEAGSSGGIAESLSQAADRRIEAVFEVDERAVWPEPAAQILPTHEGARSFEEGDQQRKGLIRESQFGAAGPQQPGLEVQHKGTESNAPLPLRIVHSDLRANCNDASGRPQTMAAARFQKKSGVLSRVRFQ